MLLDLYQGLDGSNRLQQFTAGKVGYLYEEHEIGDLDLVLLASDNDLLTLECFGKAFRRTSGSKNVIEKGDLESIAVQLACRHVRLTEEHLVLAILLHNLHLDEIVTGERKLAFLSDGDDVGDVRAQGHHRRSEKEAPGFGSRYIGRGAEHAQVASNAAKQILVLQERYDIDEIDSLDREIGIEFQCFLVIHMTGVFLSIKITIIIQEVYHRSGLFLNLRKNNDHTPMNTKKHILASLATLFFIIQAVGAQDFQSSVRQNIDRFAGVYHSYEYIPSADTPAPKGYKPFYVSHYGRHGSRHQIGSSGTRPYEAIEKAEKAGLLTEEGKKLAADMLRIYTEHNGMDGELSVRGGREHAAIAARMNSRFPEIFKSKKRTRVHCQASTVPRCLLSRPRSGTYRPCGRPPRR